MKKALFAGALALALTGGFAAQAQQSGTSMQEKSTISGNAGHTGSMKMNESGTMKGNATTGAAAGANADTSVKAGKAKVNGGADAGVKVK